MGTIQMLALARTGPHEKGFAGQTEVVREGLFALLAPVPTPGSRKRARSMGVGEQPTRDRRLYGALAAIRRAKEKDVSGPCHGPPSVATRLSSNTAPSTLAQSGVWVDDDRIGHHSSVRGIEREHAAEHPALGVLDHEQVATAIHRGACA